MQSDSVMALTAVSRTRQLFQTSIILFKRVNIRWTQGLEHTICFERERERERELLLNKKSSPKVTRFLAEKEANLNSIMYLKGEIHQEKRDNFSFHGPILCFRREIGPRSSSPESQSERWDMLADPDIFVSTVWCRTIVLERLY